MFDAEASRSSQSSVESSPERVACIRLNIFKTISKKAKNVESDEGEGSSKLTAETLHKLDSLNDSKGRGLAFDLDMESDRRTCRSDSVNSNDSRHSLLSFTSVTPRKTW